MSSRAHTTEMLLLVPCRLEPSLLNLKPTTSGPSSIPRADASPCCRHSSAPRIVLAPPASGRWRSASHWARISAGTSARPASGRKPVRPERLLHSLRDDRGRAALQRRPPAVAEGAVSNHDESLRAVRRAARQLVNQGFLLQEDTEGLISEAEASDILR
jgi:hypothetical protein